MDITTLIGLAALMVLGATCGTLALWCKYKDGVLGHAALGVVAVCALLVGIDWLDGAHYQFLPTTTGVLVAIAVFMVRHFVRALRFSRRKSDATD